MSDWEVGKHDRTSIITGYSESDNIYVSDIWLTRSVMHSLYIKCNKNVVGTEKIDPKIKLYLPKYFNRVINHFCYLDEIVVDREYISNMHHYEVPDNVVIKTLTINKNVGPINHKALNLVVDRDLEAPCKNENPDILSNIGEDLEVEALSTQYGKFININAVLSHFKKIGRLSLHEEDIRDLDIEEFIKIEVNCINIMRLDCPKIVLDPILRNPHITKLTISTHVPVNCIINLSNTTSLREIQLRENVKLNGSSTVPERFTPTNRQ